jgi:hypothetical protein
MAATPSVRILHYLRSAGLAASLALLSSAAPAWPASLDLTARIHDFYTRYHALPGDMANATRFFGDDGTACPDNAIADGIPGTCNGNGDQRISQDEETGFWQQLEQAQLISPGERAPIPDSLKTTVR